MTRSVFAATLAAALAVAVQAPAQETTGTAPELTAELAAALATAEPEAGERLFRQCQACHTIDEGGPTRTGPNLYGIVGAPVAAEEGYRYSPAMEEFGGDWTPARLDAYLEDPRGTVPGTKMTYRGLKDAEDRADMIAYLNAQSADPLPLDGTGTDDSGTDEGGTGGDGTGDDAGDGAATGDAPDRDGAGIEPPATDAATGTAPAAGEADDLGLLVPSEGAQLTFDLCTACHSEMIVAQQGHTREGWADLLVWMVEEQGMPELPQEERETVLDYLAENYNTDRPNFPRR